MVKPMVTMSMWQKVLVSDYMWQWVLGSLWSYTSVSECK